MSDAGPGVTLDAVAKFLLNNSFLLTGLELLQECSEKNRNDVPQSLKEAFSPSKLDQLIAQDDVVAWAAASNANARPHAPEEQGKIALLEYELRQERYNLQTLRREISTLMQQNELKSKPNAALLIKQAPPTLTEKRIINFLIKKHMMDAGYHMSAISFSSEIETDADTWTSATKLYGLQLAEPPSLSNLYRFFYGITDNKPQAEKIHEQLEQVLSQYSTLKEQLAQKDKLEQQIRALNQTVEILRAELDQANTALKSERAQLSKVKNSLKEEVLKNEQYSQLMNANLSPSALAAAVEAAQTGKLPDGKDGEAKTSSEQSATTNENKPDAGKNTTNKAPEQNQDERDVPQFEIVRPTKKDGPAQKRRNFGFLFRRDDNTSEDGQRIASEVMKIRTLSNSNSAVVSILTSCLPYIMSGVIIAKREELVPAIVACICWHPDPKKRYDLTNMLFNLVKIPNEQQRRVIMDGLLYLCDLAGPERTSNELLPQALEQISNKYEERRVLVAESCGWLAPHVKPELRLSLLLSIVQQLIQDKSALVRAATATNIARLLHLEDDPQGVDLKKFQQLADMLFQLLQDPEPMVSSATKQSLLPVFADWAERMVFFQQKFLPMLPLKMYQIVNASPAQFESKSVREIDLLSQVLAYLMPQTFESVLMGLPFYKEISAQFDKGSSAQSNKDKFISIFGEQEKKILRQKFDAFIESFEPKKRSEVKTLASTFEWVFYDLLPTLLKIVEKVDSVNRDVVDSVCHVLFVMGQEFGGAFQRKIIEGMFKRRLAVLLQEIQGQKPDYVVKRSRMAIGYAVSVLASYESNELKTFVKQTIIDIALKLNGWNGVHFVTMCNLVLSVLNHSKDKNELVLDILWELLVHSDGRVRRNVAKLFQLMIPLTHVSQLGTRVIPALVTLATDSDLKVRRNTARAYGDLLITVDDKSVLEKVTTAYGQLVDDQPKQVVIAEMAKVFATISPRVSSATRDTFIIPRLRDMSKFAAEYEEDSNKQKALVELIFKAYRALFGSSLTKEVVKDALLPGLVHLVKVVDLVGNDAKNSLSNMIVNLEASTKEETIEVSATQKFVDLLNPLNWQLK